MSSSFYPSRPYCIITMPGQEVEEKLQRVCKLTDCHQHFFKPVKPG